MIKKIILMLDKVGYSYYVTQINDIALSHLGEYLTSDVGYYAGVKNWIKWAYDNIQDCASGNYAVLRKNENNIIIGCLFDDDPFEYSFLCTIKQFIKILQTWEILYKQKVEGIIITQENGKIQMIGKTNNQETQTYEI